MNNSIPIIGNAPAVLTEAQQACVDLLVEALAEAESGSITSIGIVACMKSGYASVMAGTQAADLNMGCDSLKKKILDAVEDDGNRKKPSNILKVR